jgi:hypothetical protein
MFAFPPVPGCTDTDTLDELMKLTPFAFTVDALFAVTVITFDVSLGFTSELARILSSGIVILCYVLIFIIQIREQFDHLIQH